jgi:hypothetical protein
MNKKYRERTILTLIYNEDDYAEIIDSESPDFKIRNNGTTDFFGIEITEFYYSESNARLRFIPTYFSEITEQNRYRHKKDKKALEASEVTILSSDGEIKGITKAIFQQLPSIADYVKSIVDAIVYKEARLHKYVKELIHVNLIVFDTEQRISSVAKGDYYHNLYSDSLKQTLLNTEFREVFLITRLNSTQWVYIPLKMVLFVSEFYMLHSLLFRYFPKKLGTCPDDFMILFAKYMCYNTKKAHKAIYRVKEAGIEVIW